MIKIEGSAKRILENHAGLSSVSIENDIAKLGLKEQAFIGKPPYISQEHVRFNINKSSYLFAILDSASPQKINPYLNYTQLSNHLWLGTYRELEIGRSPVIVYPAIVAVITILGISAMTGLLIINRRKNAFRQ